MLKYKSVKTIDVNDWDDLVIETYGKSYCFQQQDGCQGRGNVNLIIPSNPTRDDRMNESIPEEVNGRKMGVKFAVWLAADPDYPVDMDDFVIPVYVQTDLKSTFNTDANQIGPGESLLFVEVIEYLVQLTAGQHLVGFEKRITILDRFHNKCCFWMIL